MMQKNPQIIFDFEIIASEFVALVIPITEREYLSLGVNMLTKSLKIIHTTKKEVLELIFFQKEQKIFKKYCRA